MPTAPLSPYALQKLVAEQHLPDVHALYGLETVTIRYFNVFGPRQDPSSPLLGRDLALHHARSSRAAGRRSTATASRRATSPTWPTSSTACCARCEAPDASGEVINVATGGRDLAQPAVSRRCASWSAATVEPSYAETRAGDVRDSQADISKAKRLLGGHLSPS